MSQDTPQDQTPKDEKNVNPVKPTFARKQTTDAEPKGDAVETGASSEETPKEEAPKPTFKAPSFSAPKASTGTTKPVFKMKTETSKSPTEGESEKPAEVEAKSTPKPLGTPKPITAAKPKATPAAAPAPRFKDAATPTPKPKVKKRPVQAAPVESEEQVTVPLLVVDLVAAAIAVTAAVLLYLELGGNA